MRQPLDLWGQRGWHGAEVAGESHHEAAIRNVLGEVGPEWTEVQALANLVPEPKNQFDPNAVQVLVGGLLVGYLPREEAPRYAPVLSGLVAQGWLPQVSAQVRGVLWTDVDYDARGTTPFMGNVRLDLAEPHMLVPANLPPDKQYVMLPRGGAIQVTGEVRVNDLPGGRLTPKMSGRPPAGRVGFRQPLRGPLRRTGRGLARQTHCTSGFGFRTHPVVPGDVDNRNVW